MVSHEKFGTTLSDGYGYPVGNVIHADVGRASRLLPDEVDRHSKSHSDGRPRIVLKPSRASLGPRSVSIGLWAKERAVARNHPRLTQLLTLSGREIAITMTLFLSNVLIPIAVAAVAAVLLMGLINMMRGGSPNLSQKLMRMRVLLQFIAIVITMTTVWMVGQP